MPSLRGLPPAQRPRADGACHDADMLPMPTPLKILPDNTGATATADPVRALATLVDYLRPRGGEDEEAPVRRFRAVLDVLEHDAARAAALRSHIQTLLNTRQLVGFFADSGVLPVTGFFTELGRIVTDRLLPDLPDAQDLRGVMREVFHEPGDWRWLKRLPPELPARLWRALARGDGEGAMPLQHALDQMLEALLVLGYRIGGLDVAAEFGSLGTEFAGYAASFRGLAGSTQRFVDSQRSHAPHDSKELQVMAAQCSEVLQRAHRMALRRGTSLRMTYTLRRTEQSLHRLLDLAQLVDVAGEAAQGRPVRVRLQTVQHLAALVHEALIADSQRRSVSTHLDRGLAMLALRVTDNAAKTGEHYIAESRSAYFGMWRSAMGAGLIIGVMAPVKSFAGQLPGSLAFHALMNCLIYGGGFVLIYMLHFTVATKQPAMTAQTIAGYLGQAEKGRLADLDRVVDLVAGVVRTQVAAILGNVVLAVPTAIALFVAWHGLFGAPPVDTGKAGSMLSQLDIASWALVYAGFAGVFLFLSGVISGYFDNKASYTRIGERIARLRWLNWLLGSRRAGATGEYIEQNLGGLAGNFLFGCMLGTAGTVGIILGLPIDVRHITLSAANVGYAWAAYGFDLPWQTLAWAALGVALIGFMNLTVSFLLALRMALRARGVSLKQKGEFRRRLWLRLRTAPATFFSARGLE